MIGIKIMRIYDGIYDVVAENLQAAGKTFEYEKETFLCDVNSHPQVVDVSKYLQLSNPQFFQAVFVGVYRRLPEGKETAAWKEKYGWSLEKFQPALLKTIEKSSVVAINHIQFVNNPYFEQRRGIRYRLFGIFYGLTDKSSLREFGKKLPQPIQKVIRKVFL